MFCIIWPYILSVPDSNSGVMFPSVENLPSFYTLCMIEGLVMRRWEIKLSNFILFLNFLSLGLGWYAHHVHKLHPQQRHRRDNEELHQHNVCLPLPHQLHGPTAQRGEHDQSWCQVSRTLCFKMRPRIRTATLLYVWAAAVSAEPSLWTQRTATFLCPCRCTRMKPLRNGGPRCHRWPWTMTFLSKFSW